MDGLPARLGTIVGALALAALPLRSQGAAPADSPYLWTNAIAPLARIESAGGPVGAGEVGLLVSEPAYVAIFEIVPGFGARLLWPGSTSGPERPLARGLARFPVPSPWASDPYAPKQAIPQPETRVVYLVSSRQPLGLPPLRRSPEALATAVGRIAFYGSSASELGLKLQQGLELRVEEADVLAYAPGTSPTIARHTEALTVRCGNGRDYEIAPGAMEFRCPPQPR